jgi:hypothetical protein
MQKMRSAEERRLAQVVGTKITVNFLGRVKVADDAPQLLARKGVEGAEGLVEHQEFWGVDQRAAERGALLHPPESCQGNFWP